MITRFNQVCQALKIILKHLNVKLDSSLDLSNFKMDLNIALHFESEQKKGFKEHLSKFMYCISRGVSQILIYALLIFTLHMIITA